MEAEKWQQVKNIFLDVLETEEAAREDFLSKACGGDAEIKKAVEKLLAAHFESEDFIENPAAAVADVLKIHKNSAITKSSAKSGAAASGWFISPCAPTTNSKSASR